MESQLQGRENMGDYKSRASGDLYGHVMVYLGQVILGMQIEYAQNTQFLLGEHGRGRLEETQ